MKKKLVLAEKPSVGRDLARVLNCNQKGNGYLEGKEYIVTWALGHLVTLADPETYSQKYKSWKLEDLPMLPDEMKLVVIQKTGKQFNAVKSQMVRKDVGEIIIATDAGREGELVARWIIEKVGVKKTIKRLWISSVTDKAIKDGFNKLKNGREYDNLYASAVARSEADWIVGLNATRALTTKYNSQLSCGRVQTPTLTIIAKREEEIQRFQPKTFYGAQVVAGDLKLTWQDQQTNSMRVFDETKIDQVIQSIQNQEVKVVDISKRHKKSYAPRLYDLTELQRDANKIFGYSAKETLSIMQKLYETHKALTYPRTDSRYITADIVGTLKDRLQACGVGPYKAFAAKVMQSSIKANKSFVDDAQVSDHHAIIPTEQSIYLGALSDQERKIYDLVVKRFLAVLYPPFEYEERTINAKLGKEHFIAKGKMVIHQGWKAIYGHQTEVSEDEDIADQILPNLNRGDTLKVNAISKTTGKTKPPALFTEGTLLTAMENPSKFMSNEDKTLIKTIGETGGLGTVATRADIIEKLFSSFSIEKRGKDIHITSKGKQLLQLVPEDLKSPGLTAEWEQNLSAIAKGKLNKNTFVNRMKEYTKTIVKEIKNSEAAFRHDNLTANKCPDCGKYMLEVNGKKGKMLVCQDRECGHRKIVAQKSNARCPDCKKKLELRGEGEAQIFVCSCGHREKLSTFKERRKKDQDKASKGEVNQYLKQQKKEEPINTALADALAKLKLD
ncbi:DNA topoisomerase III [Alkaliphilus metalliredigens QYMF]|uniref:DNA topoisomerase 3 n=1 Tax=Alkaliphilus metalliredigens (strain QYMF) TaxID=293826 RepID=A6TTF8_ALKMQ|nr:DNA topoisomerase III [Alkaliphilus metalliredigens]ABR49476.1 DNA topoisomerase III [Alkaliphilus metalliredigens QYMF]